MANKSPTLQTTDPSILRISERAAAQVNTLVSRTNKPVTGNIDSLIRGAKRNFTPIVGKTYHLYKSADGYVLSAAKFETENKYQFIGSFRLTAMDVWEQV